MGARPSSFAKPPEESKVPERVWSDQQNAIFDWFEAENIKAMYPVGHPGPYNLTVRARAGTGKSTTIIEGVQRAPETAILVAAFNKKIAQELTRRISGPEGKVEAMTLHSLGNRFISREWRGMRVKDYRTGQLTRAEWLTEQVRGDNLPKPIRRLISELHTKVREMVPLTRTREDVMSLALQFNLLPDQGWGKYNDSFVTETAFDAVEFAVKNEPRYDVGIDFADMIFLPLVWNLLRPEFDMVVIDEAQDLTVAQLTMAQKVCSGRICVVGDDKQCQPAGTMVRTSATGRTPIEQLKAGDTVITFDRHSSTYIQRGTVSAVSSRQYTGLLRVVSTPNWSTRCTDSHKWLVRWTNRTKAAWVTYLMRQGTRYRVGQCRLFQAAPTSTKSLNFGLGSRARVERADAAWVLKTHSTLAEALAYEQIVSCRYGLPEMCFHEASGIKHFTQSAIDTVYRELGDLSESARECLSDHGRDLTYPIYTKTKRARQGRRTLFETQACNLLSDFMAVPVAPETFKHNQQTRWQSITVHYEPFSGEVYSLEVEKHHKYIANGLVTCNSIYGFRGADSGSIDRLKKELNATELPLNVTYRCGQSIVERAQTLVPDITADPSNPVGTIDTCLADDVVQLAAPGDFVLSRLNAPLVSLTLQLLGAGKRAHMAGREIGKAITRILWSLKAESTPLDGLLVKLQDWEAKRITKAANFGDLDAVDRIRDQAGMIRAVAQDVETSRQLMQKVEFLFEDDPERDQVILSSVHKAKGLEARRVFVLKDSFYRRGQSQDEDNCLYVAWTRAKEHLTIVEGGV